MPFTISLSTPQEGSNLIDAVQESMQELEDSDWRFQRRGGVEYRSYYFSFLDCFMDGSLDTTAYDKPKNGRVEMPGFKRKWGSSCQLLSLVRKNQERNFVTTLTPLSEWAAIICFLGIPFLINKSITGLWLKSGKEDFIALDSLLTIIDPRKKYSEITFYAGISPRYEDEGGLIESRYSQQYQTINPLFSDLDTNLRAKIPQTY